MIIACKILKKLIIQLEVETWPAYRRKKGHYAYSYNTQNHTNIHCEATTYLALGLI